MSACPRGWSSTGIHLAYRPLVTGFLTALILAATAPGAVAQEEHSKEIFLLLDNSGSMLGHCQSTCRRCQSDADCGGDVYECRGESARRPGRCHVRRGLASEVCQNIWRQTIEQARAYVTSLEDGTLLHFYTFDRLGRRPVEVFSGTLTNGNRSDLGSRLEHLRPVAVCTYLYDIMAELLDRMQAEAPVPGRDSLFFVFTDGDDDGSKRTGRDIRDLLGQIEQRGNLRWLVIRPSNTLQELCEGEPNCADSPALDARWQLSPRVVLPDAPFNLERGSVEGTIALEVAQTSVFPFEVRIRWVPNSKDDERFLTFVGPRSLGTGKLEGRFTLRFEPDLARERPHAVGGQIILEVYEGNAELTRVDLPVELAVEQWTHHDKVSMPTYCTADGMAIETKPPPRFFDLVSTRRGIDAFRWSKPTVKRSKNVRPLGTVDVSASDAAFHDRGVLRLELTSDRPRRAVQGGQLRVSLSDENGWVSLTDLRVPVDVDPEAPCGAPPPSEICANSRDDDRDGAADCDDSDCASLQECQSTPLWPLPLPALLIAAVAVVLLRKPAASFVELSIEAKVGPARRIPLLKDRPLRLGAPRGQLKLLAIADPDELQTTAIRCPADAEGLGTTERADLARNAETGELEPDQPSCAMDGVDLRSAAVEVVLEKDGAIVLEGPAEVFRVSDGDDMRANPDRPVRRFRAGRLLGGRLVDRVRFRVLDNGPWLRLVDGRRAADEDQADGSGPAQWTYGQ